MKILGICNDETASACLFRDGKLVAAASEERFSRIKMDNGFPFKSIEYCLSSQETSLADIDVVAYAWSKGFSPDLLTSYVDLTAKEARKGGEGVSIIKERVDWEISRDEAKRREFDAWVSENVDVSTTRVADYYHHEAHAASAALLSPFDRGMVLTCDGRGDFESLTIWQFDRGAASPLKKLYSANSCQSFGFFYGRITGLLGFTPMRHEGKVTGLAAYGDSSKAISIMRSMIDVEEGAVSVSLGDRYRPFFAPYSDALVEEISALQKEDVAAAAQRHLEDSICSLLSHYLAEADGPQDVMLAGGVFGNVKLTQNIKELQAVKSVFVQPQMGDGGLCLGAACLAGHEAGLATDAITSMYLGPEADLNQIPEDIERQDYSDLESAADAICADLIAENVVGLIQGRMEFGPRALCNRSIIYKTADPTINDWLNKRMNRTEFMPFAPVIRRERAAEAFPDFDPDDVTLSFMTSTVNCTDGFKAACPAVTHVDQTARPQVIERDANELMWLTLRRWESNSDELSLVNTSFNAHEEPIILNVEDGLQALSRKIVDVLYVSSGGQTARLTLST